MKNLRTLLLTSLALLVLSISFSSCKKKDNTDITDEKIISTDNSFSERTYDDAAVIADQGINGDLQGFKNGNAEGIIAATCATITHDTTSTPNKVVIDFGTVNCLCADGKNRRGKINVEYTGNYFTPGSYRTITFDNYFVQDHQVLGTTTVTTNGQNSNGKWNFTISSNGSIIKPNNGGTITYTSTRNREWTVGDSTPFNWTDDIWTITGSAQGTAANGMPFTADIIIGLEVKIGCPHLVKGKLDLTAIGNNNNYTWSLDYGNGTCDDQAVLTKPNGTSQTITLP